MSFGTSMILGGRLAKALLPRLGPRGFTSLANAATLAGFLLWAAVPEPWAVWSGLLAGLPGMERRAAVGSVAVDHAVASGMGRGEYAAAFANWRALMVVVAPMLYAKVYASGAAARRAGGGSWPPGSAYFVGAAAVLAAELLLRSIPDEELFRFRQQPAPPPGPAAAADKAAGSRRESPAAKP